MKQPGFALALVHHPVLDRRGEVIATAVTNLDLHDLVRTARTFGVSRVYVVTPVTEQQRLVATIRRHWVEGFGAGYNPHRSEALQLLEVVGDLDEALQSWRRLNPGEVVPVLTGASRNDGMSFAAGRTLAREKSVLLVLGTGWGLAPEFFQQGWPVLEAVAGAGDYNHLPVRAAAAIMLDRLLGPEQHDRFSSKPGTISTENESA